MSYTEHEQEILTKVQRVIAEAEEDRQPRDPFPADVGRLVQDAMSTAASFQQRTRLTDSDQAERDRIRMALNDQLAKPRTATVRRVD